MEHCLYILSLKRHLEVKCNNYDPKPNINFCSIARIINACLELSESTILQSHTDSNSLSFINTFENYSGSVCAGVYLNGPASLSELLSLLVIIT